MREWIYNAWGFNQMHSEFDLFFIQTLSNAVSSNERRLFFLVETPLKLINSLSKLNIKRKTDYTGDINFNITNKHNNIIKYFLDIIKNNPHEIYFIERIPFFIKLGNSFIFFSSLNYDINEFLIKNLKIKTRVTLGLDPELEIFDIKNKSIVSARYIINSFYTMKGHIGLDGQENQLEFRPYPSTDASLLILNLNYLIYKTFKTYPFIKLNLKGDVYALGCHIHIGLNLKLNDKYFSKLIEEFDKVGELFIKFSGRARGSYKKLSAIKTMGATYQDGIWGFEYRSLPAIVMYSKKYFKKLLKLFQETAIEIANGNLNYDITNNPLWPDMLEYQKILASIFKQEFIFIEWDKKNIDKPCIRFSHDTWNLGSWEILERYTKTKTKNHIFYYGLNKSRGLTYQKNIEQIENEKLIKIGLPYELRINPKMLKEKLNEIINLIEN